MAKKIKGEWVKYESEPGKWFVPEDTSYKRLYRDLEAHKQTGWPLGEFADNIYGEFLPCDGTIPGDMYVYYTVNKNTGKRKPKLVMTTFRIDDKPAVTIWGLKRRVKGLKGYRYDPKAKYLEVILQKLREIDAKEWAIEETTNALSEYKALIEIAKNGVKGASDILTIYRNYGRIDTFLARRLLKGRNIQEDYDSLDEASKIEFIKSISYMNASNIADLTTLTSGEASTSLCVVENVSVLRGAVKDKGLQCLKFAPLEYRKNKEVLLEILSDFDISKLHIWGIEYISEELQADVDILRALIRTEPYEIGNVFSTLTPKNEKGNKILIGELKKRRYMLSVLDMYFRLCISIPDYQKEKFLPADVLWYFHPNMTEGIESEILCGPFKTDEEEEMKRKVPDAIKLVRTQIESFRKRNPGRFED